MWKQTCLLHVQVGGKYSCHKKKLKKQHSHSCSALAQETFLICIFMNSTNHSTASTFNTRARMSCQQKVAKKPVSSNALQETNGYCFEQPDKRVPKVLFRGHRQMNFQLGRLLVSSRADGGGNLAEALICRWERWLVVFLLAATPSYRSSTGRI